MSESNSAFHLDVSGLQSPRQNPESLACLRGDDCHLCIVDRSSPSKLCSAEQIYWRHGGISDPNHTCPMHDLGHGTSNVKSAFERAVRFDEMDSVPCDIYLDSDFSARFNANMLVAPRTECIIVCQGARIYMQPKSFTVELELTLGEIY